MVNQETKEEEILRKGGTVELVQATGERVIKKPSGEIIIKGGPSFVARKGAQITGKPIEEIKEEIFVKETGITREEARKQVVKTAAMRFEQLKTREGVGRALLTGAEKRLAEPFQRGFGVGKEAIPEAAAAGAVFGVSAAASKILLKQPTATGKVIGTGIKVGLLAAGISSLVGIGAKFKAAAVEEKAFILGAIAPQALAGAATFTFTTQALKVDVPKFKTKVKKFGEVRAEFKSEIVKLPSGKEIEVLTPTDPSVTGGIQILRPAGAGKTIPVSDVGGGVNFLGLGLRKGKKQLQLQAQIIRGAAPTGEQRLFLGTETFNVPLLLAETRAVVPAGRVKFQVPALSVVGLDIGRAQTVGQKLTQDISQTFIQKQKAAQTAIQKTALTKQQRVLLGRKAVQIQKVGIVQKVALKQQQKTIQKTAQRLGIKQALRLRSLAIQAPVSRRPTKFKTVLGIKRKKKIKAIKRPKGLFLFPSTGVVVRAAGAGIRIKTPRQTIKAARGLVRAVKKRGIFARFDPSGLLRRTRKRLG